MEEKKIALVIKTEGLEFDDRVRKEILSVQRLYPNIKFKIFAMLPSNKEVEGVTGYGVPYKSVFIPAREKYPSATKIYLKGWQFYKAIKNDLKKFDAVWVANMDAFFVTTFVKTKHLLWDLHELPYQLFGSKWKRKLLKYTLHRCDVVVHANPQRAEYMKSINLIEDMTKHFALRNYPDFADFNQTHDEVFRQFLAWKEDRKCVYLQGLNGDWRAAYESIAAVMRYKELIAVVVGGFDASIKEKLQNDFGQELNERIRFIGKIPQLKIPQYVEQCFMSLVFYKNIRPNNWYCEANRFYQAVVLGVPVVVGNNPSMRELVQTYGFGVSIDDDGRDIEKITAGIKELIENYEVYRQNVIAHRQLLAWDNQDNVVQEIINKLFD